MGGKCGNMWGESVETSEPWGAKSSGRSMGEYGYAWDVGFLKKKDNLERGGGSRGEKSRERMRGKREED